MPAGGATLPLRPAPPHEESPMTDADAAALRLPRDPRSHATGRLRPAAPAEEGGA